MGRYEWALVIMNNAPVVSDEFSPHGLAAIDRFGNPHFEKFTAPLFPTNHITTVLQNEEKAFAEEAGDASLRLLAAPGISADEKTVYNLLSDIIARSSWDHLTKIRSRALVRPAEMDKAKNRFMKEADIAEKRKSMELEKRKSMELEKRKSMEISSQKGEGKTEAETQMSSEMSPVQMEREREQRQQAAAESKDEQSAAATVNPESLSPRSSGELSEPREAQEYSEDSIDEFHEVTITSMPRKYSAPTFSITRDLDVDDALTQFLVEIISSRSGIHRRDVSLTPMNIEIASSPMIPVCDISRTMDVAFHAIFQDIKAFHTWKEEEKKLGLVGLEDFPQKIMTIRPVADWIRIAIMCERLSFTKDAHRIYKMLEPHHIKALESIVSYDAERGDIKSTLIDASSLMGIYTTKYNVHQPHPVAVSALIKLISSQGLHKVRSMESSLMSLHPLIQPILLDAVRWKSKGFDV
jgi:hypothetical protein